MFLNHFKIFFVKRFALYLTNINNKLSLICKNNIYILFGLKTLSTYNTNL